MKYILVVILLLLIVLAQGISYRFQSATSREVGVPNKIFWVVVKSQEYKEFDQCLEKLDGRVIRLSGTLRYPKTLTKDAQAHWAFLMQPAFTSGTGKDTSSDMVLMLNFTDAPPASFDRSKVEVTGVLHVEQTDSFSTQYSMDAPAFEKLSSP